MTPQEGRDAIQADLLALNTGTYPFTVSAPDSDKVDLVVEWRIIDAEWTAYFASAKREDLFKVLIRFDLRKRRVRTLDVETDLTIGPFGISASMSRGQKWSKRTSVAFGIRKDGTFGKLYDASFNTGDIKKPIREIVEKHGWKLKQIYFGKL